MTNLEIALSVAEVATLLALARLYRKQLIIRHLFIRSSNWCAQKIDEMTDTASWRIMTDVQKSAKAQGKTLTDDEARDTVPLDILNAKKEWQEQMFTFQDQLTRNRIRPLDGRDLDDLIWYPWMAGIKD